MASQQTFGQRRISLPFRVGQDGRIATTTSVVDMAADEIKSVVMTMTGERLMENRVGGDVSGWVFDVEADTLLDARAGELKDILDKQISIASIHNVSVTPTRGQPTALLVTIDYEIPAVPGSFRETVSF